MDILISHNSAFALYDALDDATLAHRRTMPLDAFGWDSTIADAHPAIDALPHPLHILIPFERRHKIDRCTAHCSTFELPGLSTIRLQSHLYVVAPELCFMQLARSMDAIDIAQIATRLTATYRYVPDASPPLAGRLPLTTIERLALHMDSCGCAGKQKLAGASKVNRGLAWAIENAASPREAALALTLAIPARCGGFGLPRPALNRTVPIPPHIARWAGKQSYRCDLFWPDASLAIEYDSDLHAGSKQIAKDAKRRDVLSKLGITTLTVTRVQMNNIEEIRQIAVHIGDLLGTPKRYRSDSLKERQRMLHARLLHSRWL